MIILRTFCGLRLRREMDRRCCQDQRILHARRNELAKTRWADVVLNNLLSVPCQGTMTMAVDATE